MEPLWTGLEHWRLHDHSRWSAALEGLSASPCYLLKPQTELFPRRASGVPRPWHRALSHTGCYIIHETLIVPSSQRAGRGEPPNNISNKMWWELVGPIHKTGRTLGPCAVPGLPIFTEFVLVCHCIALPSSGCRRRIAVPPYENFRHKGEQIWNRILKIPLWLDRGAKKKKKWCRSFLFVCNYVTIYFFYPISQFFVIFLQIFNNNDVLLFVINNQDQIHIF